MSENTVYCTAWNRLSAEQVAGRSFYVTACGYTFDRDNTVYNKRPNGLIDYQLLYLFSGKLSIQIEGFPTPVSKGNVVLFRPYEPQIYVNIPSNEPVSFAWIHIIGSYADEILNDEAYAKKIYHVGEFHDFFYAVKKIVAESRKREANETLISSYAVKILGFLPQISHHSHSIVKYADIICRMNETDGYFVDVKDYAAMCGMTVPGFICSFSCATGYTPHQYKTRVLLERATYLLLETDRKVSDISKELGFWDPLYFSRVFRKNTGLSPGQFRRQ